MISLGPVRTFVVNKVNDQLNGHVEIADWSVGWTGGIEVSGVKVYDQQQRLILELGKARTGLSILDAIRGNYDLGQTSIDRLNLVRCEIDEKGVSNYQKLAKASEPARKEKEKTGDTAKAQEPSKLPPVRGTLAVNDFQGTIEMLGPDAPPVLHIEPSQALVKISDLGEPIDNQLTLVYRLGNGTPGTVKLGGKAKIAANGVLLATDKMTASEKLELDQANFAAATPLLAKQKIKLGGVADGSIDLNANGMNDVSAEGAIKVVNFLFSGEALKGDTFQSKTVNIPLNVSRKSADGKNAQLKVQTAKVELDQGTISLTADVPEQSLSKLGELMQQAVQNTLVGKKDSTVVVDNLGGSGNVALTVDLDVGTLAKQLPNTVKLADDAQITGGHLAHHTQVAIKSDRAEVTSTTDLTGVSGTNKGQPVKLDDVHVAAGTSAVAGQNPDLRDIKLELKSGFATVEGGGASLAKLAIKGDVDLAKAQQQAEQFVRLDDMVLGPATQPGVTVAGPNGKRLQLAGTTNFQVTTDGDPTKSEGTLATTADVNMTNVDVTMVNADGPLRLRQPYLALHYGGTVERGGSDQFAKGVKNAVLTLQSGDSKQVPTVDLAAGGDVTLGKALAANFHLDKLAIPSLPKAQQQYGLLVPALQKMKLDVVAGSMSASVAGAYDGSSVKLDKPLQVAITHVTVEKTHENGSRVQTLADETIKILVGGTVLAGPQGKGADLTALSVNTSSNLVKLEKSPDEKLVISIDSKGALKGGGSLAISSNLKKAIDLAEAFTGQPINSENGKPVLSSGLMDGTLKFTRGDKPQTEITGNFNFTNLTIPQKLEDEQLKVALAATAPDDVSSISAKANVESSFAKLDVPKAQIVLTKDGKPAGTWEMVQYADVGVNVPALPKLMALVNAFQPAPAPAPTKTAGGSPAATAAPTTQPLPPLDVTSGSLALALNVTRQSQVTNVNVSDLKLSQLAFKRGDGSYRAEKDMTLKLAAAIDAADDPSGKTLIAQQIKAITVSDLTGSFGVADISLPSPLKITSPGAANMTAQGQLKVGGRIENLMDLLDALSGKRPTGAYFGDYAVVQNVGTRGDQIALSGSVVASQLRVRQEGKDAFTEPRMEVVNDLSVNMPQKALTIANLSVAMKGSDALALKVVGTLNDWEKQRQLQGMSADVTYDLEKLWPIVHPMLIKPGQPDEYKDTKVSGKFTKTFRIEGSYPADQTPQQAVKLLKVTGGVAVGLLDHQGINVQKLDLPVKLQDGHVTTDGAPAAVFNSGELNLAGMDVDLTQEQPRLTTKPNLPLVKQATLNPVLADKYGKFINPTFVDPKQARGLMDLTIVDCDRLPLGDLMMKRTAANDGRLDLLLSLTEFHVGNEFVRTLFQLMNFGGQTELVANVKNAKVGLQQGIVNEDMVFDLSGHPLAFQGKVGMEDLRLMPLHVTIPSTLLRQAAGKDIVKYLPEGIEIPITGTTTKPELNTSEIPKLIAEGGAKAAIGQFVPGANKSGAAGQGDGASPKKDDPLGGLIDAIGGNKNKDGDGGSGRDRKRKK